MQRAAKLLLTVVVGLLATACSSTQNLKDGRSLWGGGFSDEELRPGLYSMTAIGNLTPWASFAAAKGTWSRRADQLCGTDQYQEIITSQDSGYKGTNMTYAGPGIFVPVAKFNSSLHGYVLCNSSGLSKDQALQFIESVRLRNATALTAGFESELSALGGSDCSTANDETSAENLSKRGQLLSNQSRYAEARVCLIKAISRGESTGTYRESCEALGRMYEMGWGVPASLSIAKEWYKKAGLL
jgi:hypothetical protein